MWLTESSQGRRINNRPHPGVLGYLLLELELELEPAPARTLGGQSGPRGAEKALAEAYGMRVASAHSPRALVCARLGQHREYRRKWTRNSGTGHHTCALSVETESSGANIRQNNSVLYVLV
jgi:hypothetical protein